MSFIQGGTRTKHYTTPENKPCISIIIVTYNAAAYVQQCINSIAAQSFQNYELLIFDGNSTDNTVALLQQNNNNITYWQSEPDKGIYDAMNKALQKASAHWFYFLGIDDILLPGFSEMATKLQYKQTIYTGNCITDKGVLLDGKFTAYRLTKMNISHQVIFYPRQVFQKYNYQLPYKVYADYVLNLQCWGDRNFKIQYYPITLAVYCTGGFSSFLEDELFKKEKDDLIKKYLSPYVYLRYLIKKWKLVRKR